MINPAPFLPIDEDKLQQYWMEECGSLPEDKWGEVREEIIALNDSSSFYSHSEKTIIFNNLPYIVVVLVVGKMNQMK